MGRGRWTNNRINAFQNLYGFAIRSNKEDPKTMEKTVTASLKHCCSRSQNFRELYSSAPSSYQNDSFVNTSKRLLKNRNWTSPVVRYFTPTLKFVSYILARTVDIKLSKNSKRIFNCIDKIRIYQSDYKTTQESKTKRRNKRSTKRKLADSFKRTEVVKYASGTSYRTKKLPLLVMTCSESTIEILKQCVKYV